MDYETCWQMLFVAERLVFAAIVLELVVQDVFIGGKSLWNFNFKNIFIPTQYTSTLCCECETAYFLQLKAADNESLFVFHLI